MRISLIAFAGLAGVTACGGPPTVAPDDLAVLVGDDWEGTLTYLDYSDNATEVTLPAELAVAQNGATFELYFSYPDEPQANGRAEVTISEDGRQLNTETLTRSTREDETLHLVAEAACGDNGQPATCEYEYSIAPTAFSITNRVTPESGGETIVRNTYSFTR